MPPLIPTATYRLQFTPSFGFDDATRIVPYLKALGISHLYASPFLKARTGSTHGYDIVDHNALNPEFGGEEAFLRLSEALAQADLGLILDFVPNHMGVHYADNAWWLEVLEWGPKALYASFFDIDWQTLPARPQGGVLVPILGVHTARRSKTARSNCVTIAPKEVSQPGTTSTACRSPLTVMRKCSKKLSRRRARTRKSPAGACSKSRRVIAVRTIPPTTRRRH
jgi:maltooligosyltrehalose synthase